MTGKRLSNAICWVYAAAILFGVGVICWQVRQVQIKRASRGWPRVEGKMIRSVRTFVPGKNSNYRADVSYSYRVNGTNYLSQQVSLWSKDLRGDYDSQGFVSTHPADAVVDVYYEPGHPDNAVLVPGANEEEYRLFLGLGTVCVLAGIGGMTTSFRRRIRLSSYAPERLEQGVTMKTSDIKKGRSFFLLHFGFATCLFMFAVVLLLTRFVNGPTFQLESVPKSAWPVAMGIVCAVASMLVLLRGIKGARGAECPICGNLLPDPVFLTGKCNDCGIRIRFEESEPEADKSAETK